MSVVVYALLTDEAAEAADDDLRRSPIGSRGNVPQLHRGAPIDANLLPEGATEFGKNLIGSIVGGAVFMALVGAIAGATDLVLGLGVGLGVALGFITGALMGLVGAMQAGTRVAKAPLRELEARLDKEHVLLVIEVGGRREAESVVEIVEAHAPSVVETLAGW